MKPTNPLGAPRPFLEALPESVDEHQVFVAMPFSNAHTERYHRLIRKPLQALGFRVVRADEIRGRSDQIVQRITTEILRSTLIIGDLIAQNPNVLFEVGLATAFGKEIILLASTESDVPANLRHLVWYEARLEDEALSIERLTTNIQQMNVPGPKWTPRNATQRVIDGSYTLGITDIVDAATTTLGGFMLKARKSIDAIGSSGHVLFDIDISHVRQFIRSLSGVAIRILLLDPKSDDVGMTIEFDNDPNVAGEILLSARRLTSEGLTVRFYPHFMPWAGVIIDDTEALIQFNYPGRWNTKYILVRDVTGGMFQSLRWSFRSLYDQSRPYVLGET